jgi:hypothetical protein
MAVEDTVGDIVGIAETVANSVAICETVLMRMIVADRDSARTPILARNSLFALGPGLAQEPRIRAPHFSALFCENEWESTHSWDAESMLASIWH